MDDRDLLDELPHGLVVLREPECFPVSVVTVHWPRHFPKIYEVGSATFTKESLEMAPYPEGILSILLDNSVKDLALSEDARMVALISQTLSGTGI